MNLEPRLLFYIDHSFVNEILSRLHSIDQSRYPFRILLSYENNVLVHLLQADGFVVDVLAKPYLDRDQKQFWKKFLIYFEYIFIHFAYLRKLSRYYKMFAFELIHVMSNKPLWLIFLVKLRFNITLIFETSSPVSFFKKFRFLLMRSFYKHVFTKQLDPQTLSTLYNKYLPALEELPHTKTSQAA